jgi:hypothetical protein
MKTRTKLAIDAVLLTAYVVAANPRVTGTAAHEWASLGFALAALVHLVLHRDWVARTAARFFARMSDMSRADLIVDVLTAGAVTAVTVSGLMISRTLSGLLGLGTAAAPAWRLVHAASAAAVLVLALAHLALHWKWIVRAAQLHIVAPIREGLRGMTRPALPARIVAWGVPALLLSGLVGMLFLGVTGASAADSGAVVATSSSSGTTLTCPRTGCTASSCHATSGGAPGRGPAGGGR